MVEIQKKGTSILSPITSGGRALRNPFQPDLGVADTSIHALPFSDMDVGRLSRQFGRSRSGFLEGRALCSWFGCLFLGLCFYGDAFCYYLGPRSAAGALGYLSGSWLSSRASIPALPVSYTHLRAHETRHDLVCRLLL